MGRKRSSVKEKIMISVDKDIIDKLREFNVNRSLLFTDAAEKCIEILKEEYKNTKKGLD